MPSLPFYRLFLEGFVPGLEPQPHGDVVDELVWPMVGALRSVLTRVTFFLTLVLSYLLFSFASVLVLNAPFGFMIYLAAYKWRYVYIAFAFTASVIFSVLSSAVLFLWRLNPERVELITFTLLCSFTRWLWVIKPGVGRRLHVLPRSGLLGVFIVLKPLGNIVLNVSQYWRKVRLSRDLEVFSVLNVALPKLQCDVPGALNPTTTDLDVTEYFKLVEMSSVRVSLWDPIPNDLHPAACWVMAFARVVSLMRITTWDLMLTPFVMVFLLFLFLASRLTSNVRGAHARLYGFVRYVLAVGCASVLLPSPVLDLYGFLVRRYVVWPITKLLLACANPWNWLHAWYLGKLLFAAFFIMLRSCVRFQAPAKTKGYKTRTRFQARFNSLWTAVQQVISDVNLPSFVRTASLPFNEEGLQATLDKLSSIGWPVNVSVTAFRDDEFKQMFPDWAVAGLDFNQTIRKVKLYVDDSLKDFEADDAIEYRRTEGYASYVNELKATSRYFQEKDYKFIDLAVDEVWELLAPIFEKSRLAAFDTVIKRWEKSYGLAPWAKVSKPDGTDRKLRRSEAIRQLGTERFYQLWQETFFWAPSLVPIAPVSIKREALPPKKWQNDKLRTIIGAPLTHYISSTVWNYYPNHNFKYLTTPIKVGLPLNGAGMGTVYARHSHFDIHYAGDCSEFDSTLSGKVVEIIKEVRKKGFRSHKDYPRIAELIDREYINISSQLLATTSQGNVWRKGTGLSTGHSSTSMDNSIGMVVLYLMAWKQVTNLSAKDFKHFVELSVYGDDHLISWRRDAPATWTWKNIQMAMASWGVTNNLEAHGDLEDLEFLSKYGKRPSSIMRDELAAAGISAPDWCVYHNRSKLVGKIKAMVVNRDLPYQATRLRSYLLLTAHHRDIYDSLVAAISLKVSQIQSTQPTYKLEVPTYDEILRKWYDASTKMSDPDTEIEEWEKEARIAKIVVYGSLTFFDVITNFLGRIVDVVNPEIYNSSLTTFLMTPLKPYLSWPLVFLREANMIHTDRHLEAIVSKSGYDYLNGEVLIPQGTHASTATSRLFKHWVYCAFRSSRSKFAFQKFLWVDKKIADIKYLLFGHVDMSIRRLNVPMYNMCLAACLGAIPDFEAPDYRGIPFLPVVLGLNIGVVTDAIFAACVNRLAFSLPANFSAIGHSLPNMKIDIPMLVEAPTGSGKSTALIERLRALVRLHRPSVKRIVVVEPRAAIVEGVVPYMKRQYNMSVTGYTSNMKGDPSADVAYVTPLEVALHPTWVTEETLFVVDECHIEEPLHAFIRDWLISKPVPVILTTATPSSWQYENCQLAPVKTVADWQITDLEASHFLNDPSFARVAAITDRDASYAASMLAYYNFVVTYINGTNPYSKHLVFVNTIKEQESLERLLRGGTTLSGQHGVVCCIRSGQTDIPDNASVIITTSVSDVGVTIPAVDVVFTTNTILEVRPSRKTGKNEPVTYTAPASLIKQRRGRTGRTNNGTCIVWRVQGLPEYVAPDDFERVSALLCSGFTMSDIADMMPKLLAGAAGSNVSLRALVDSWGVAEKMRLAEVRKYDSGRSVAVTGSGATSLNFSVGPGPDALKFEVPDWFGPRLGPSGMAIGPAVRWNLTNEITTAFNSILHWAAKNVHLEEDLLSSGPDPTGSRVVGFLPQLDNREFDAAVSRVRAQVYEYEDQLEEYETKLSDLKAEYAAALSEQMYYGLVGAAGHHQRTGMTWHSRLKRQHIVDTFLRWIEGDAPPPVKRTWANIMRDYIAVNFNELDLTHNERAYAALLRCWNLFLSLHPGIMRVD